MGKIKGFRKGKNKGRKERDIIRNLINHGKKFHSLPCRRRGGRKGMLRVYSLGQRNR